MANKTKIIENIFKNNFKLLKNKNINKNNEKREIVIKFDLSPVINIENKINEKNIIVVKFFYYYLYNSWLISMKKLKYKIKN